MDIYSEIISMIGTISVINLIAVILQGTKRILRKGEGNSNLRVAINLGIVGGLFGMYSSIAGYVNSNGAVISIRDVGPMMAGCLGGPLGGFIAGIIAGIFRLFQGFPDIFSGTTIPCSISTLLIGVLCGIFFRPFEFKKNRGIFAFVLAILMEWFHLFVVLMYYVWFINDSVYGWQILNNVGVSFISSNAIAFGLMIFTTDMIDRYKLIEKNEDAIEVELKTATDIQKAMLPKISSNFPDRKEFSIFSNSIPAKQVGGDFYDFHFIDNDHFAFLISDVSGKGVPSALFMVIAKTTIKNNLQLGLSFEEAIEKSNNQLYEDNKESMFVTSWIGILEISTGKLQFINAGHNYPIIKKSNGEAYYLNEKSGVILAGKKNSVYTPFEIQLQKGDELFLYTDGITEAVNFKNEQFGEDRLLRFIKEEKSTSLAEIWEDLNSNIDDFCKNVNQFDDITAVILKYNGDTDSKLFEANIKQVEEVTDFVNGKISSLDIDSKTKYEINIIIDEIFSNIVKYSGSNSVEIGAYLENSNTLTIVFEDKGLPYNPLNNKEIDRNLSAQDREYGGLGIGIVKELANDISYQFIDGKNRLIIKKLTNHK